MERRCSGCWLAMARHVGATSVGLGVSVRELGSCFSSVLIEGSLLFRKMLSNKAKKDNLVMIER